MGRMIAALTFLLAGSLLQAEPQATPVTPPVPFVTHPPVESDLTLDDVFQRVPFFGRRAFAYAWSHDDRYVAYLWNPHQERGADIWVYDTREGKSTRLSNIRLMAEFDRETGRAITQIRRDDEERERMLKMDELEYRKWLQERRREDRERREPRPDYEGPRNVVWAHGKHEFLFTFRGDLFRWRIGEQRPVRLTDTREAETDPRWTRDDEGMFFRRGDGVFRMRFDSAKLEQLNPELPHNMPLHRYWISPDERWLAIQTGRQTGQPRQVDYIVYRERFAQARRTARDVADDPFRWHSYVFLYDLHDDPKANPRHDGKPWEVYRFAGGPELEYPEVGEFPWSADSRQFVYGTFKRATQDFTIMVADLAARTTRQVYAGKVAGEDGVAGMSEPMFLPDGRIVALLETTGFRHPHLIDPVLGVAQPLTEGHFDMYHLRASKDGRHLYVRGLRESLARMDLYRVEIGNRQITRLTSEPGTYGSFEVSPNGRWAAAMFNSWSVLPEMRLIDLQRPGREKELTSSHRPGFWDMYRVRPRLFSYQNRHGHTIWGYMFLPPGFDKADRRPLYIDVYGGPLGEGKSVVDGSYNTFSMYLAYAMGYVAVTIDPRGQSGYGAVFSRANWERPGVAQVEDLADGVKWLVENYGIDPAKVAVSGWSFGSWVVQKAMYSAPDVFTLGIAGAGPTEWQNYNNWYTTGAIGDDDPAKDGDLDRFSLTHIARNLRSPLLLLHGVEDTNVLFQDTISVYRQLLQFGKGHLVELAIDPTGGHGMGGDMSTRDRKAIYVNFLLRHFGQFRKEPVAGG
jgi:dipeptidyl aminopeptidase/acylaminoacyl peptidase